MPTVRYLTGLISIIAVVWLTMIICLAIVYRLLPPLDELTLSKLAISIAQFLLAGTVIVVWLFSWNILVRFYFRRNLNVSRSSLKTSEKKRPHHK